MGQNLADLVYLMSLYSLPWWGSTQLIGLLISAYFLVGYGEERDEELVEERERNRIEETGWRGVAVGGGEY